MSDIERDRKFPVASEASKRAAKDSGLPVRWHALDGELVPFVPLSSHTGAVEALRAARDELGRAPIRDQPTPISKASGIIGDALDRLGGQ